MPREFDQEMSRAIAAMMRREADLLLGVTTSTNAAPAPALDLRTLLPQWERMLRNARRSNVTFVVDRAHPGGPLCHETPGDGERIELSWLDANRVHQQWPLKLHQVLSADAAEFVPALVGEVVPVHLVQPPFDLPDEETLLGDWLIAGDRKD